MSPNVEDMKMSFGKRANKPLMEKKRRERINGCLQQLKSLVMESLNQEGASQTKLEKADILEMTVKHLEEMKSRGQLKATPVANKRTTAYRHGYQASVSDVTSYLWSSDIAPSSRTGIIQNMAKSLENLSDSTESVVRNTPARVEVEPNNNDCVDGFSNCSPQKIKMELLSSVPLTPIDGVQSVVTSQPEVPQQNAPLPIQIATSGQMITAPLQRQVTQSPMVVSLQQQPILTTIPATNAFQTGLPNGLQIVRAAQVGENVILLSNDLDQGQYRILQVQQHGMQIPPDKTQPSQGQPMKFEPIDAIKENVPTQTLPSISTFSKGAKRRQSFDQMTTDVTDQSTGSTYTVLQPVKRQCLDYYGHYDHDENVWRPWSKSEM